MTRQQLGRGVQFVGMLIPPFAIASELMDKMTLGQSMLVAALGMGVFYVGYVMQHKE